METENVQDRSENLICFDWTAICDGTLQNGPNSDPTWWKHSICKQYHFKFFKGCLLQILLRPFLNALYKIIFLWMLLDLLSSSRFYISHPDYSVICLFQHQPLVILPVLTLGSRANPWLTFSFISLYR